MAFTSTYTQRCYWKSLKECQYARKHDILTGVVQKGIAIARDPLARHGNVNEKVMNRNTSDESKTPSASILDHEEDEP